MNLSYIIDDSPFQCEVEDDCIFQSGDSVILSDKFDDLIIGQDWYNEGHTTLGTEDFFDFDKVKYSLGKCIFSI